MRFAIYYSEPVSSVTVSLSNRGTPLTLSQIHLVTITSRIQFFFTLSHIHLDCNAFCRVQVVLAGAELGNSVDEVDSLLKKHENTEKLIASQDEKVANLCEFGETLMANGHNEAEKVKDRVRAVCERRNKLNEELQKRRHKLEESKKIAQFYQDVIEVRK